MLSKMKKKIMQQSEGASQKRLITSQRKNIDMIKKIWYICE